jgi:exopolysaccharide biosynthesis protein
VRSDDGHRAERTALCVRDAGRTVVVIAEPRAGSRGPSLFALAQYLAAGDQRCEDALNLDGGPSTGVAYRGGEAAMSMKVMPPRGPLRYALVMRDR